MEMQVQAAAEKILSSRIKAAAPIALAVKGKFTNTALKTGHYNDQSKTKRPPRKAAAATAKIESLPNTLVS
jgi:hypothetical protein